MYILGISALYHDSAASLIKDGQIIAAAQEERFTRRKHDSSFPKNAISYCLKEAGIEGKDVSQVVYYDNPTLTLSRFVKNLQVIKDDADDLLELQLEGLITDKIWINGIVRDYVYGKDENAPSLVVTRHHISHAASAFYPSPYSKAAILTNDGVGEWETTTLGVGENNKIRLLKGIDYPHSIGLLYSAFTYYCGFKVNSGDYKFMGLAPYGEPVYYEVIKEKIINIKEDGSYSLNLYYFDFQNGRAMTNNRFDELFGGPRRQPESRITKREMDIAASMQKVIEEIIIKMAKHLKSIVGDDIDSLVMAGGCALNCVANGVLRREKIFKNIWIQPAAGDAGGALGCALYYWYSVLNNKRICTIEDTQRGSYLGRKYSTAEVREYLDEIKAKYVYYDNEKDLYNYIAELLDNKMVIGLFHGRMEFGPRALGNRSIIGDPRSEDMQTKMNLKIKYRESFRPFAPAVLEEDLNQYFDTDENSPYMLFVDYIKESKRLEFDVQKELCSSSDDMLKVVNQARSDLPAITHVDYSARIQTVSQKTNPYFYGIIDAFKERTGCGVIVNTSFNVRGEPIVCTPMDAYTCFMRTEMDALVLENCVLLKNDNQLWEETEDWRNKYELD